MMNFASPYLLVLSVLLPLSSFAAPADDFLEVRAFIEAQVQKHDSELNDSLRLFSTSAKLPVESHFNLYGANLMVTGPQQTYHDCANNNCKYYERNFFKQYAEFRYEN